MTSIPKAIQDEPAASRPLPLVRTEYPSAARGIPDVRAHLDGPRCCFCNVPVAEDEQRIRVDLLGTMAYRHVCKGHSEHPESFVGFSESNPENLRHCPRCGMITKIRDWQDLCLGCSTYLNEGEVPEHYTLEARSKILSAGDRDVE